MEENVMLSLEEFLKKYGIDASNLTTKEKLEVLKQAYITKCVDCDCEELRFSKIPDENRTEEMRVDFVRKIRNLELDKCNILGQIAFVKVIRKEERRLRRKEIFQKILKPLKGRD